jgi:hypothetical protein
MLYGQPREEVIKSIDMSRVEYFVLLLIVLLLIFMGVVLVL